MKIKNLKNKKIAILGYGKEGKSTLSFLLGQGIKDITILDKNSDQEKINGIKTIFGENYLDNLGKYDLIIKSPGISPYNKKLEQLKNKLSSQTKIFFENYNGKVIGITGTKGKSTTSTLVYKTLKNAGFKVKLVGNIGNPVLEEIDIINDKYDYIIYELSSYMLEDFQPSLYIGILINIYPDHLDWHGDNFENYKNSKLNIISNSNHTFIGMQTLEYIKKNTIANLKVFGGTNSNYSHKNNSFFINGCKINGNIETSLLGNHNKDNFCAILGLCDVLGIKIDILLKTIQEFKGLEHRLQNLGIYNGVTFIDDAISTTPESTIAAINSSVQQIGTLILGGTNRGYNFEELVNILDKRNILNIVLLPDSGEKIKQLLSVKFNILETSNMDLVIKFAFKNCKQGEVCLLSTASPSYSLWKNYIEKGDSFKSSIIKYGK